MFQVLITVALLFSTEVSPFFGGTESALLKCSLYTLGSTRVEGIVGRVLPAVSICVTVASVTM